MCNNTHGPVAIYIPHILNLHIQHVITDRSIWAISKHAGLMIHQTGSNEQLKKSGLHAQGLSNLCHEM